MRDFLFRLLAPKICHIDEVVLTRGGRAYWVRPGKLVQMRVVNLGKLKSTEEK